MTHHTDRTRRSGPKVGLATLGGTIGCMLVAVSFNMVAFAGYGPEVAQRAAISAVGLTAILATPLFLYAVLRLRGLALSNIRLSRLARTDGLTACLNRNAFIARCTELMASQARRGRSGALLVIDADYFKRVNDRFGHDAGDEALSIIARTIRAVARPTDLVGRMGGEEFAVYLPDAEQRTVAMLAERIRRAVMLAHFAPDGRAYLLSVSIGSITHVDEADFATLFHEADQRLYAAKHAGRNRVVSEVPLGNPIAA
jgi:diguanylate cyclase